MLPIVEGFMWGCIITGFMATIVDIIFVDADIEDGGNE